MNADTFQGRLGLQQRVIPSYRALFLDTLAKGCTESLSVFAGEALPGEAIEPVACLKDAQLAMAKNRYLFDPSSPFFLCWQIGFIEWLEAWQPDVLIVEANPRYLVTGKAIGWMHDRGKKVIGWGLGAPPIRGIFASYRRRERSNLLHTLDAIIAYSKLGADQYREIGLPEERVFTAFNAIDPPPKVAPPERPAQFKERATVLFVGRLQRRKRVDLLLRACADLPAGLQPDVLVVGDGPTRSELENLGGRIYPGARFEGSKHGAELEPYFDQADLFVLPGTGGLAIQQAMSHGLPVIVAHGDGTQEDLVRGDNGWLVAPDDLAGLTMVLQKALSDPRLLREMGKASYRIVAEEINVDKMVEVFIRAANEVRGMKNQPNPVHPGEYAGCP